MKREVLFIVLVVFSLATIYGQTETQVPPPCGLSPTYVCDIDGDGFEEFDLPVLYPFRFCMAPTLNAEDYNPTTYYESSADAISGVNAIVNPSFYTNTNPYDQEIFFRAEKTVPDGSNDVLFGHDFLYIMLRPTVSKPKPVVICDYENNDGIGGFSFRDVKEEILSGQKNYSVSFFESYIDAQNLTNQLPLTGYVNTTPYSQTIFARIYIYEDEQCFDIVEIDLKVQDKCEEIEILLYSDTSPRPGFNYVNHLIVKNTGTEAVTSGTVEFAYDSLLTFNSVSNVDSNDNVTPTSNGFTLNFNNLNVGEEKEIDISMYVPTSVSLDTKLTNSAVYTGADFNQDNNTFDLSEIVIGSFDPNDIMESHGPKIQFDEFTENDYLYYTIRFQNVGTADAINVRIENELDSQIDESTFQLLASSHTNNLNRLGKKLTWTFNNIHLPSEDINEPESHGFVYYKIKPKAGFTVGDIIPNTAAIYFDFNEPVITNTFQTEFEERLSVGNNSFLDSNLYPNPASDYINIEFKNNSEKNIEIFDVQGKLIMKKETQLKEIQINISNLVEGLYFVKIKDDLDGGAVIKKIIIK